MTRRTSRPVGRGHPLSTLIAGWAPKADSVEPDGLPPT